MAGPWDSPPTEQEMSAVSAASADPWAAPPTPEEMGGAAPPKDQERFGAAETFGRKGVDALIGGFGDEIAGQVQSTLNRVNRNLPAWANEALGLGTQGLQEQDSDLEVYRDARGDQRRQFEEMTRQNPKAALAGTLTGAVASAALPGGAITQGALAGLGNSEADLTRGEFGGALADTGLGAVFGKAGQVAGKALGRGVSNIASRIRGAPQAIREVAEESAAKVGNPMLRGYRLEGEEGIREMGRELLDSGLVRFGDSAGDVAPRLTAARAEAGKAVGDAVKKLDSRDAHVYADDLAAYLENSVLKPLQKGTGGRETAAKVAREIEAIRAKYGGSRIPFTEAEVLKRSLDNLARDFTVQTPSSAIAAMERLRGATGGFNDMAAESADPALAATFKAAKERFGKLAPAEEFFRDFQLRGMTNRALSLTDYMSGLGGGWMLGLINNIARTRGRSAAAVTLDKLAGLLEKGGTQAKTIKALAENPNALGKSGELLLRALAKEGPDAFEALHFALENEGRL